MTDQLDMFALFADPEPEPAPPPAEPVRIDDLFAPVPRPDLTPTCQCDRGRGEGQGYSNVGGTSGDDWWVHVRCGLPTPMYAAAMRSRSESR